MKYYIYILRNPQNKLYIGFTIYIPQRQKRHDKGDASLFTKRFKDFHLVHKEEFDTQLEAMRREKQLKGWTRAKKEALIVGNKNLLKRL